jgi:hypothetical protein
MVRDILSLLVITIQGFLYLCLLNHKVAALNAFSTYKVEVEKQNKKEVKIVKSNGGR